MEITGKPYQKRSEQHLHSASHALADELANKFSDKKRFGFYLKMATTYDHGFLRRLAGEVLESRSTKNPGALFAFLIKKYNKEQSELKDTPPPSALTPSS
jgi:formamidopyrimidine-DNA glycosylase